MFSKFYIQKIRSFTKFSVFTNLRQICYQVPSRASSRVFNSKQRSYKLSLYLSGLFVVNAWFKADKGENKVIQEADLLYEDCEFGKLFSHLSQHRQSDDPEILWRLARAVFENCRNFKEDSEKLSSYEDALKIVDRALEINEKCWAAHKWRAILLDCVWKFKSTKGRLIHSFDIKKHLQRAIELNPKDSTSYYILGEWCFTFADMPWYQRKAAAAIFATPPTSSYEEALELFEKAEEMQPLFYSMNLLMIGKCYLRMNSTEKAIDYFKKLMDYPLKTADDQKAHEEAVKLLKDLKG